MDSNQEFTGMSLFAHSGNTGYICTDNGMQDLRDNSD